MSIDSDHCLLLFQVKVGNFASDWNDGIALASLVDATAPGLFPEWEDLDPANKLDNATEAMKRAEDWLGVPQVCILFTLRLPLGHSMSSHPDHNTLSLFQFYSSCSYC